MSFSTDGGGRERGRGVRGERKGERERRGGREREGSLLGRERVMG